MQLLDIQLKTPDLPSLVVTGFIGVIVCGVSVALIVAEVVTVKSGMVIAIGVISGSLSNAYGVSVKDQGWRGVVLSSVFSLLLMALVNLFMSFN